MQSVKKNYCALIEGLDTPVSTGDYSIVMFAAALATLAAFLFVTAPISRRQLSSAVMTVYRLFITACKPAAKVPQLKAYFSKKKT